MHSTGVPVISSISPKDFQDFTCISTAFWQDFDGIQGRFQDFNGISVGFQDFSGISVGFR